MMKRNMAFSTNNAGKIGHLHTKKMNINTDFVPFTKINSKLITDLSVKRKTLKLLEDNIREYPDNLGFGDSFLATTSKAQSMK